MRSLQAAFAAESWSILVDRKKICPSYKRNNTGALSHIRVVELGDIPASYATRLLADLGADVIKVEPPGGDPNRLLPPFAGKVEDPERSLTFINANTNKRSIVLDLPEKLH